MTSVVVSFLSSTGTTVLTLNSAVDTTYTVSAVAPSEEKRVRATVSSPDMHGEVEVSSVLAQGSYTLVVRCKGPNWAAVWSARNTLVAAATAFRWRLSLAFGGATAVVYAACAADVSHPLTAESLDLGYLDVTLAIPINPVPLT